MRVSSQRWTGRRPSRHGDLFHTYTDRLGHHVSVGPWWLHFSWCRYGWSFYAFRRRLAWRPIDYSKVDATSAAG